MLIACDECRAMISDRAVSCPQCGIPKVKAAVVNDAGIAPAGSKEQIATIVAAPIAATNTTDQVLPNKLSVTQPQENKAAASRPKSSKKKAMIGLLLVAALGLGSWLVFRVVEPASTQSPDLQPSPAELAEKLKAECRSGQPAACFTLAQQACDADDLELCVALAMKVEQEAYLKFPESHRSFAETQSPLFKSLLALYANVCERGAILGCYRKIKFTESWPFIPTVADEIRANDESRSKQCDAGIEPACEWTTSHAQPSNAAAVLEKMCLTHPTPYFRAHACLQAATTIKNDWPRNRKRLDPRVPQLWAKSCLGFETFQSDSGLAIRFDEYGDLVNHSQDSKFESGSRAQLASMACTNVGSTMSNESLAEPYFTIACNQGRASSCYGLAKIYLSKAQLYKPELAFAALQKACFAGAFDHCQEAATLAIEGKLIVKDEAAAQTLLETACKDSDELCFELGNFFLNHSQLENHREIAMLEYRRACDSDNGYGYSADATSACLAVADLLLKNQTEGDAKAAFDVLVKGCQHAQEDDHPFQSYEPANIGCERAVHLLAEGTRIPRDIVAAAQLKSTFCDKQQTPFMRYFGRNGYFSARVAKFCRKH